MNINTTCFGADCHCDRRGLLLAGGIWVIDGQVEALRRIPVLIINRRPLVKSPNEVASRPETCNPVFATVVRFGRSVYLLPQLHTAVVDLFKYPNASALDRFAF